AGERAERGDVVLLPEERPEPLGAAAGDRVLDLDRPAQPDDLLRRVRAYDPLPPLVRAPLLRELGAVAVRRVCGGRPVRVGHLALPPLVRSGRAQPVSGRT